MSTDTTDVFGRALLDWSNGGTDPEVIERDDGFWEFGAGYDLYQARFPDWLAAERASIRYVRGRVIDVGCGAGRVPLYLQQRGFNVVGLDSSTLAVRAARRRGVKQVWRMSLEDVAPKIGAFDTIVLFGNNFGVFGTPDRLRRVLSDWARSTPPGARILAGSTNPYCGGAPGLTRSYYFQNCHAGRMPGQVRLRVRYRRSVSPWFDWLFVSRREMRSLLHGTGWRQRQVLGGPPSEPYVAVLEKDALHT
ncbi:MAG TPA: class I SAM-dependent methyltransferase [Acidimicrobiales bacterium]|nr:class I SAM-dependent methyltransferase [Acidimicrobiales bacterium]